MSKNSQKQLYTQLMEWMSTVNIQRKKRVKPNQSRLGYYKERGY